MNVPEATISAHNRSYSGCEPSHQCTWSGRQSRVIASTQVVSLAFVVGRVALVAMVGTPNRAWGRAVRRPVRRHCPRNPCPTQCRAGLAGGRGTWNHVWRLRGVPPSRAGLAARLQASTEPLDELAADRGTQAGARFRGPAVDDRRERLEPALEIRRIDPDLRVAHCEADILALGERPRPETHLAVASELGGVAEEVLEHLPRSVRVADHRPGRASVAIHDQLDAAGRGAGPGRGLQVAQQLADRERGLAQLDAPGLDACQIENAIDQTEQVILRR
jgi:hypothetical protein